MTGNATTVDHQLAIDTIRTLAIDGVQQANSGHPGTPMGAAPMAYVLWTRFLRHAPTRPDWIDRDRFVLSAGHASMLLYSMLHLTGYDLPLKELKRFRQFGSRTPGHPEYGMTPGVEATTGPLGQGFANAVGMAMAERRLAIELNRPGHDIVDHRTYVLCSDGDLQEGISSEAASLAGHLRLGRLIVLYDDNDVQLDGPTSMAWSEDAVARFDAYGWHTQRGVDGTDLEAIAAAIEAARADERPSLIAVRTVIGYGSPNKAGSQKAHGAPLGADEVRLTKQAYGLDPDLTFHIPAQVLGHFREAADRGEELVGEWEGRLDAYAVEYPAEAAELERRMARQLPTDWDADLPAYEPEDDALATRNASKNALQALKGRLPELIGGSADLSESNLTDLAGEGEFQADPPGRNIRFGVREHAMGGIANGIAYHGGFLPFVGTFLNFSDYMRGSVRLAALTGLQVTYVWTHDSVGLGEDGPTHQPVEHYAALRAMPNLTFVRPGDPNETSAAWALAIEHRTGPTALALTRQKLPVQPGTAELARQGVRAGAYVLAEAAAPDGTVTGPQLILIATGSELQLAMAAREILTAEGVRTRVVSMPSWERFERQPAAYRAEVLPPDVVARVSIEVGASLGWERWVRPDRGAIMALDRFGMSAPGEQIFEQFGFTVEHVVEVARGVVVGEVVGVISPTGGHGGVRLDSAEAAAATSAGPGAAVGTCGDALMDTRLTLPGDLQAPVDEAIARAVGERWASRIWARDTRLWTEDEEVAARIAQRLGWLDAPTAFEAEVAELTAFGEEIEREGFRDVVVLGMGGSSLAPEVLDLVYPAESDKGLRLHVLDSTHPEAVAALDAATDPERTLRIVATKSGTTTETLAFLAHHWAAEEHRVGRFGHAKAGNGFVSTSDPGGPLAAIPHHDLFRETFLNPPDVGGRYSALTYVGLVPGALMRLDLDPLLEDGRIMAGLTRADADDNPALVLGAAMAALARLGRDKLTFVIEPDLAPLGAWLEQLIAESTGKDGIGIVPVDGEPLGEPSVYGPDRVFVRLGPGSDEEWHRDVDARLAALTAAGHPLIDIRLDDASWVGAEFFRWEFATAVAGIALGVDPFDEPNVTESKQNTARVLEGFAAEGGLPAVEPAARRGRLSVHTQVGPDGRPRDEGDLVGALRAHVRRVPANGYLQVGAYIAPTEARTSWLRALQARLRDVTGRASTFGYGPRFLHSTGQLHKGGPPTGCFIQITGGAVGGDSDVPIPGRPETFGVLIRAQALGDFEAFGAHDLPVIAIDLGDDVDAGLDELAAAFDEALA